MPKTEAQRDLKAQRERLVNVSDDKFRPFDEVPQLCSARAEVQVHAKPTITLLAAIVAEVVNLPISQRLQRRPPHASVVRVP